MKTGGTFSIYYLILSVFSILLLIMSFVAVLSSNFSYETRVDEIAIKILAQDTTNDLIEIYFEHVFDSVYDKTTVSFTCELFDGKPIITQDCYEASKESYELNLDSGLNDIFSQESSSSFISTKNEVIDMFNVQLKDTFLVSVEDEVKVFQVVPLVYLDDSIKLSRYLEKKTPLPLSLVRAKKHEQWQQQITNRIASIISRLEGENPTLSKSQVMEQFTDQIIRTFQGQIEQNYPLIVQEDPIDIQYDSGSFYMIFSQSQVSFMTKVQNGEQII